MDDITVFIHTHKCAGTSVIDLFRKSDGVAMYPRSRRRGAMPSYFRDLRHVESYGALASDYGHEQLQSFFSQTAALGINFLATEWVVPPALGQVRGTFTFTVFRDPLSRYVSNYRFDTQRGYSKAASIWNYYDSYMYRRYNYFTRLFASKLIRDTDELTDHDYEQARAMLHALDAVIVLERPESFGQLRRRGVDQAAMSHRNASKPSSDADVGEFAEFFRTKSGFDYALYEEALRLASA